MDDQLRLIETTRAKLALMQGHGNHQRAILKFGIKHSNRPRQQLTQLFGCGKHSIIFQKVNKAAQLAVVTAKGDGAGVGRRCPPAEATLRACFEFPERSFYALATHQTQIAFDGDQSVKAWLANRKPGNIQKWGSAKAAIGRKEGGEQALGGNTCRSNQERQNASMPLSDPGSGRPDWVTATAEDEPPAQAAF